MTFDTSFQGAAKTIKAKLTTTDVTTLYTLGDGMKAVIKGFRATEVGSGSRTVSLLITNTATDYYLAHDQAVASDTSWVYDGPEIPLSKGDVVKVHASASNTIDVFLVIAETGANRP